MHMKKMVLVSALAMLAMPAYADDFSGSWFLRAGLADLNFSHKLSLVVGGQPVPGAALKFNQIYTPIVEIGRTIAPDWSVVASLGLPPTTAAYGAGSIAPYGKLEGATFGPSALTVQFQPIHDGFFRPYAGVGLSYMIIFNTSDAAVQKAKLSNDLAPVIELGSEFPITDQYGLFLEAKKAFLQTKTGGTIGGYPLTGKASIEPWVFALGATAHF
jgi:outer membrane protein